MITCPRCGAENKPEASVCRMCATTLDPGAMGGGRQPQPAAQEIPATVLIPSPGAPSIATQGGGSAGKLTCPGCQATNDADWAFCQQCGTRLHAAPAQAQAPNWGAPTVVAPNPGYAPPPPSDPRYAATVVTPAMPPMQPPADLPTIVTPPQQNYQPQPPQPQPMYQPPPPRPAPPVPPAQDPALFAPTVVTPVPSFPSPPASPRDDATDQLPPSPTAMTPPGPAVAPEPDSSNRPTDGAGMPSLPVDALPMLGGPPPASDKTMVMSSTPVAAMPKQGKLHLIMEGGETGETYDLRPSETIIGRVDGDIKFPHDGYMSGRHARIIQRNGHFFLIDNNSRNGTFIKIHQEVELNAGDVLLVGKQLFRFEADE